MTKKEMRMSEGTGKEITLEDLKGPTTDPEEELKFWQRKCRGTRMPFGKHKGRLVHDLPTGCLTWLREWLIERDNFPDLSEVTEFELQSRLKSGGLHG